MAEGRLLPQSGTNQLWFFQTVFLSADNGGAKPCLFQVAI
jgi:hypothetical protein